MINQETKPTSTSYFEPTPSTRKKLIILKVIACVIIPVVIGVGIVLATRVWDPLWNPFRPSPEEVIGKMAMEMGGLKTVHSRTKIGITGKEDAKEIFKISMDLAGDSDNTDPENPKSAGEFYIALAFEGTQFSLAGENKNIGEGVYIKLTTIPALPFLEPFFEMMGIDLKQIKNQWIKLDMEEETQETKERQEEMIQKFQSLLKDKKLYIVRKEFSDKEIRNQKVYHYLVALNKEEIRKLMPELFEILWESYLGPQFQMMQPLLSPEEEPAEPKEEIRTEFLKSVDEFLEKISEITAETWIGKKDFYLYKIKGEKIIDLAKFDPTAKGKISIKFDMDFSDFDKPVKIEAPEEFKTLEEILGSMGEMISESLLESQSRARDARRQADLRQIQTATEIYYSEEWKYLQSKTMPAAIGTYLPSPLVDPGNGPCPGSYQWISNVKDSQKYCIYACLENGKFFAVSHKGSKELDRAPTNLDCW